MSEKAPWIIGAALVALFCLLIYAEIQDEHEWQAFAAAHHCQNVGVVKGEAIPSFGLSSDGKSVVTTTVIPDKTIYHCDDGYQVIR